MIRILRGQANTVVLTLKEKATLSSPTYLFEFQNQVTRGFKRFIASDNSSFKDRYNRFTITESNAEDLLNGTVKLEDQGLWDYNIYEQSSTTNLDPAATTSKVESGLVRVGLVTINTFIENTSTDTFVEYGTGA